MQLLPFRTVLKAAIIAGLIAGLCTAGFHFVFTEPVIDQAIQIEEQRAGPEEHQERPLVSRDVQKGGLFLGFLMYGLSWGLLFTVAYHLLQRWLTTFGVWQGALLLAFLAYWSIVLIPFIKYPTNPPGVGDPATIGYRQQIYITFLLLSPITTALAVRFGSILTRRLAIRSRWWLMAVLLGLFAAILVFVMPNNPDPVDFPAELLLRFRLFSLAGLTIFWVLFGICFGWLAHRTVGRQPKASLVPSEPTAL